MAIEHKANSAAHLAHEVEVVFELRLSTKGQPQTGTQDCFMNKVKKIKIVRDSLGYVIST